MALDLDTRATPGYPADLRGAAGIGVTKRGLRADLAIELRDVQQLASAPTGGLVPVQDPVTGRLQALDFQKLPTAQPGDGTVTNTKAAPMPAQTLKVNTTNAPATPQDAAPADVRALLALKALALKDQAANSDLAPAPSLTLKGNTTNANAQPQDVPLATLATTGNPLGDEIRQGQKDRAFTGTATRDSKAIINGVNGPYTDFSCRTDNRYYFKNTEVIPISESGGMRDQFFIQGEDQDATNYEASNFRAISNAIRVVIGGTNNGSGSFTTQWKDLHGGWFTAIGRSGGVARGMSGILAESIQLGTGVATNEFSAACPTYATEQAALVAPVLAITYNGKANADATHKVWGVQANLYGYLATAAFRAASVPAYGQPGYAQFGVELQDLVVTGSAIIMPQSAPTAPNAGTVISYDSNDYTYFDRATNTFYWVIGGQNALTIDANTWISSTPAVAPASGAFGAGATCAFRYKQVGKSIFFTVRVSIPTNGTAAGNVQVPLPVPAYALSNTIFMAFGRNDATGAILQGRIQGSSLLIFDSTNNYPAVSGAVLIVTGEYEAA